MNDNLSAYDSGDYDSRVGTVLPYYSEFHRQVIDLVRTLGLDGISWLDTGCGTGSLVQDAYYCFDNVKYTLCDPSPQMLATARSKTGNMHNYICLPSQELSFENEFDIVTAIQAHHYLDAAARKTATECCYRALKEGGIYICFENIALSSEESNDIGTKRWRNFLSDNGKSNEEIEAHIARRGTEVFPITIDEHLALLKECGFKTADILWASYMQAGFFAIK